jgi:tetratricopeptide (TPR) repeat protein
MNKIISLPVETPSRFGFERVRKRRRLEDPNQLKLFPPSPGQVLRLPTNLSPFEEALLLDERDDDRAEALYRRAIAEGDLPADANCNLGIRETRAGRTARAFDCFTKSLAHDPRHFEAHYNLGNLYFEADNFRLARLHYELAAEIDPVFPNLHFNLGLVLILLEEKKAALEAFRHFQSLAPPPERKKAADLIKGLKRSLTRKERRPSR